jgi:hypothetical protein
LHLLLTQDIVTVIAHSDVASEAKFENSLDPGTVCMAEGATTVPAVVPVPFSDAKV